ncbi:unnamed protein product [Chrysodeixis includens]|uniref:Uncharacterized protein n=1 Tax=Chrysodeixis includens TaxID=689277 RepID=A0A9P0E1V9_CHRIL|nr:unnamed protein product [Chrysodeixis includens]
MLRVQMQLPAGRGELCRVYRSRRAHTTRAAAQHCAARPAPRRHRPRLPSRAQRPQRYTLYTYLQTSPRSPRRRTALCRAPSAAPPSTPPTIPCPATSEVHALYLPTDEPTQPAPPHSTVPRAQRRAAIDPAYHPVLSDLRGTRSIPTYRRAHAARAAAQHCAARPAPRRHRPRLPSRAQRPQRYTLYTYLQTSPRSPRRRTALCRAPSAAPPSTPPTIPCSATSEVHALYLPTDEPTQPAPPHSTVPRAQRRAAIDPAYHPVLSDLRGTRSIPTYRRAHAARAAAQHCAARPAPRRHRPRLPSRAQRPQRYTLYTYLQTSPRSPRRRTALCRAPSAAPPSTPPTIPCSATSAVHALYLPTDEPTHAARAAAQHCAARPAPRRHRPRLPSRAQRPQRYTLYTYLQTSPRSPRRRTALCRAPSAAPPSTPPTIPCSATSEVHALYLPTDEPTQPAPPHSTVPRAQRRAAIDPAYHPVLSDLSATSEVHALYLPTDEPTQPAPPHSTVPRAQRRAAIDPAYHPVLSDLRGTRSIPTYRRAHAARAAAQHCAARPAPRRHRPRLPSRAQRPQRYTLYTYLQTSPRSPRRRTALCRAPSAAPPSTPPTIPCSATSEVHALYLPTDEPTQPAPPHSTVPRAQRRAAIDPAYHPVLSDLRGTRSIPTYRRAHAARAAAQHCAARPAPRRHRPRLPSRAQRPQRYTLYTYLQTSPRSPRRRTALCRAPSAAPPSTPPTIPCSATSEVHALYLPTDEPTQPAPPHSTVPRAQRRAAIDPAYHPVLSDLRDVSPSLHLAALVPRLGAGRGGRAARAGRARRRPRRAPPRLPRAHTTRPNPPSDINLHDEDVSELAVRSRHLRAEARERAKFVRKQRARRHTHDTVRPYTPRQFPLAEATYAAMLAASAGAECEAEAEGGGQAAGGDSPASSRESLGELASSLSPASPAPYDNDDPDDKEWDPTAERAERRKTSFR